MLHLKLSAACAPHCPSLPSQSSLLQASWLVQQSTRAPSPGGCPNMATELQRGTARGPALLHPSYMQHTSLCILMGCLPFAHPPGIIPCVEWERCDPPQACFPSSPSPSPCWNVRLLTPTLLCSSFFQTFPPIYAFHPKPVLCNTCTPPSSTSPPNSMGRQAPTSVLPTVW